MIVIFASWLFQAESSFTGLGGFLDDDYLFFIVKNSKQSEKPKGRTKKMEHQNDAPRVECIVSMPEKQFSPTQEQRYGQKMKKTNLID